MRTAYVDFFLETFRRACDNHLFDVSMKSNDEFSIFRRDDLHPKNTKDIQLLSSDVYKFKFNQRVRSDIRTCTYVLFSSIASVRRYYSFLFHIFNMNTHTPVLYMSIDAQRKPVISSTRFTSSQSERSSLFREIIEETNNKFNQAQGSVLFRTGIGETSHKPNQVYKLLLARVRFYSIEEPKNPVTRSTRLERAFGLIPQRNGGNQSTQ